MIYDAYKEPYDNVGACIPTDQINTLLAPYNLEAHQTPGGRYVSVTPKDNGLEFPTNWEQVADEVVCCGEPHPYAKLGRKKWKIPQPGILRDAVLSPCGQYRYVLTRTWGPGETVTWVMLNPSTADAMVDDATIRKCIGFARAWGYDGIRVVNLFALRSRDPLALVDAGDPYGPDYWGHFNSALCSAGLIIAAWGCESTLNKVRGLRARAQSATMDLRAFGDRVKCLGMSKKGTPYHPLMLAYSTPTLSFNPYDEEPNA